MVHRGPVRYLGRVAERGDCQAVCDNPRHSYTLALISAVPVPDPAAERTKSRITPAGNRTLPPDPAASLRFLPSRLLAGEMHFRPLLKEVAPGHFAEELDPLEIRVAAATETPVPA